MNEKQGDTNTPIGRQTLSDNNEVLSEKEIPPAGAVTRATS